MNGDEKLKRNLKELRLNILAGACCTSFSIASTHYLDSNLTFGTLMFSIKNKMAINASGFEKSKNFI